MTDAVDLAARAQRETNGASERREGVIARAANAVRYFLGRPFRSGSLRENLADVIEEHAAAEPGALAAKERVILMNVLAIGELRVEDVMVPRADILAVEVGQSFDEVATLFREAGHSRLPIFRDTLDDPIGMAHVKDVYGAFASSEAERGAFSLTQVKREILFAPPSMPMIDLLLKMQATRIHMALVIDEYGGTDGLVTIEDLIEPIVGEIEDEHDDREGPLIAPAPPPATGYVASARAEIDEVERMLEAELAPEDKEEEIDTLGGLIFTLIGRVPQRGEVIGHAAGFEFEILDADPRRIKRVRIHRRAAAADDEESDGADKTGRAKDGSDGGRTSRKSPPRADAPAA